MTLLDEGWAAARVRWPDDGATRPQFDEAGTERGGLSQQLAWADLYVALSAAQQVPWALTQLERSVGAQRAGLRRLGLDDDAASEVLQALRTWLLVPVQGRRRLLTYSAHGPLEAWLRTIATRQGLRVRRAQVEYASRLEAVVEASPELAAMKSELRRLFNETLREAMGALAADHRALLHEYYVDRLTIDDLATRHGVHRATAARWVAGAQRTLLSDVRRLLLARHELGRSALNSALRLVRSGLDVSWSQFKKG